MSGRWIAFWLVAGIAGSLQFWLVQVLTGGPTITAFMGQAIVAEGGYPESLATLIGWGVHLGVSFAYALLFGVVVLLLGATAFPARVGLSLAIALLLGGVTTAIAPPAISVTIALLSGQGWPPRLFPLNTEVGLPFWNHITFFVLSWVIQAVGGGLGARQPAASSPAR